MPKEKKQIDWPGIERDFGKTNLPIRELARWYGVTDTAIRLRAKAAGWERPGAATSQATLRPIAAFVAPIVERVRPVAAPSIVATSDIVERGRHVALRMLDELEATTSHLGELAGAIEEAAPGPDNASRRGAMMKAIDLNTRATILKNLALATKTLADAHAPAGKKAAALEDARNAGAGSEWGDDLGAPSARPN